MNVAQLIAGIIAQGLVKIPNQSAQTQADAQAFALAAGSYLSDLAKDELLAELNKLPLGILAAKIPALAGLGAQGGAGA